MTAPVILITGASRGLGAAAARLAAQLGANVILSARSAAALEAVAGQIRQAGGSATVIPADVSQPEECRFLVKQSVAHFGRLDALVNNAGVLDPIAALADADPAALAQNLAVNVLGPMVLTQAALPNLRQSQGRVINVSSGAAVGVVQGWIAYCASKAALNHLNRVLAAEEKTVTAIALRPGIVDTEMQAVIRQEGKWGMTADDHNRFMQYHQESQLLPPESPGLVLAVLALYAPHEWSGEFMSWDEERVQRLVEKHRLT